MHRKDVTQLRSSTGFQDRSLLQKKVRHERSHSSQSSVDFQTYQAHFAAKKHFDLKCRKSFLSAKKEERPNTTGLETNSQFCDIDAKLMNKTQPNFNLKTVHEFDLNPNNVKKHQILGKPDLLRQQHEKVKSAYYGTN